MCWNWNVVFNIIQYTHIHSGGGDGEQYQLLYRLPERRTKCFSISINEKSRKKGFAN